VGAIDAGSVAPQAVVLRLGSADAVSASRNCDHVFGGRFVIREKQQNVAERVVS
jgi:hypothetical protein